MMSNRRKPINPNVPLGDILTEELAKNTGPLMRPLPKGFTMTNENTAQTVTDLPKKHRIPRPSKQQLKKALNVVTYTVTGVVVLGALAKKSKDAGYEEAVEDVEELDSKS